MNRRQRSLHAFALSALALVFAAGCGSSSKSASDSTTTEAGTPAASTTTPVTTDKAASVNPCDLVSLDDAKTAIGSDLNPGTVAGPEGEQSCTYTGVPTGPTAQVEVFAGPGAKKYLEIDQTLDHVITPVAGIGDEAHIEDFNIFFRKGTTWVAIRLTSLDDPGVFKPRLVALATAAAAKL